MEHRMLTYVSYVYFLFDMEGVKVGATVLDK